MRSEQTNGSNCRHQGHEKHHHGAPLGVRVTGQRCSACFVGLSIRPVGHGRNATSELPGWSHKTKKLNCGKNLWDADACRVTKQEPGQNRKQENMKVLRKEQRGNGEPGKLEQTTGKNPISNGLSELSHRKQDGEPGMIRMSMRWRNHLLYVKLQITRSQWTATRIMSS